MSGVADASIDLIVTSPPYPMIEMWDEVFNTQNQSVGEALALRKGGEAFDLMHCELDKTWQECSRVLKPGGIACINIGDATRTINSSFRLYSNHSHIIQAFAKLGFNMLPVIIWRKQTNAPNKFMGSGMLPGAYVTLEHEYILIFVKGARRTFDTPEERLCRQKSAFFWEERNKWFSDVWFDLKGISQNMAGSKGTRERSGAFPFELAYRLISMYSVYQDLVLDPFLGTGTTTLAAMAAGRNSIGIEIDDRFQTHITQNIDSTLRAANGKIDERLSNHLEFVREYTVKKGPLKHVNENYQFPVVTKQETKMQLFHVDSFGFSSPDQIAVTYTT